MFRKLFFLTLALTLGATGANAQFKIGGKSVNLNSKAAQAAVTAVQGITLSDAQVRDLCLQAVQQMDQENTIAGPETPQGARLAKLTAHITQENGLPLNFKVYQTDEVNAFATGDGSIRVYSGLMAVMDDAQLMAIIGHEIGHVVGTDVKDAMKNAYMTSAGRQAVGAAGGTLGKLSESQLGDLSEAFLGAKFSQKQEFAADDYGFGFAIRQGYTPYAMAQSLEKLVELSGSQTQASMVQKMFSSHPDSAARAARVRAKADSHK